LNRKIVAAATGPTVAARVEFTAVRILFLGTPEFAVPSLRAIHASKHEIVLVVAQPDRPAGRGMKLQKPAIAATALELGLPLEQPEKLGPFFYERVRELRPDAGAVVAYGKILRPALLEIPPHGFLNVHGSLLPRWRGAAPVQRAIEAGDRITGVSIMQLDEQLDHGPVFATATVPIDDTTTSPQLFAKLSEVGGPLLVSVLDAIEAGSARATEQDHDQATHAGKIEKEEGRVDWSRPAQETFNRSRAFSPWPGTFIEREGETIKLHELAPVEERGAPGSILSLDEQGLTVGCGVGALRIGALQRPGKRPAPAADVARALGIAPGDRLT
jgi:methionyl-tRNA formyltransferase